MENKDTFIKVELKDSNVTLKDFFPWLNSREEKNINIKIKEFEIEGKTEYVGVTKNNG